MSSSPFRILLVDDSAPFRRQVGGALEASGLCVVEATEGVEALWRARAEGVFDLVLLDIHMPNLDGLSFIREVRKLPGYARIPIVVVTSDGSRERRLEGRAAGATAWLLKPPDIPGLINAVHAGLMGVRERERDTQMPRSGALPPASVEPAPRSEVSAPFSQRFAARAESLQPLKTSRFHSSVPAAPPASLSRELTPRSRPPSSVRQPKSERPSVFPEKPGSRTESPVSRRTIKVDSGD
jgi:two-component system, chemotaxis family, chemotaxis protein CheY